MRLETALSAGREGITAHGQAISVVGDNIANTNTTAYKTSRAEFCDMLPEGPNGRESTTISGGGCGVAVSGVRSIFDGGVIEDTGRSLDCGIDGGGFFMVGNASNPSYSRAGNFSISLDGYLQTNDGQTVLGYAPGSTTLAPISLNNIKLTGSATSKATLVGNIDAASEVTTAPTNPATFIEIGRAASAVSSLAVYDSLGQSHDLTVAFFKTANNTWTAQAYIDGGDVGQTAGVPVQVGNNATLNFSSNGTIDTANLAAAMITATPAYSNGATAGNFPIDLSKFTQFAAPSNLSGVSQDGQGAGNVSDFEIRTNGELYASLDSGTYQLVGTIQLADFLNKDGLERVGNSTYIATDSVGTKTTGSPGAGSLGKLKGGAIERSTVDISNEFVNLIVLQRGYQASSQTIQAANQLIQDTISLVR